MISKIKSWFPDIETPKRKLSNWYCVFYGVIAASFSGFYLYTSGFGLVSSESNRAFYLLFTSLLVFLSYPANKNKDSFAPSILDFVFIIFSKY